jgi:ABC-type amino acid transport system permease subunit
MLLEMAVQSAPALLLALMVAGIFSFVLAKVAESRKISRLGQRAKSLPTVILGIFGLWRFGIVVIVVLTRSGSE